MSGNADCPVCLGEGGWEDPIAEQSVICYLCHPGAYKTQTQSIQSENQQVFQPWLKGYDRLPCKYPGPAFAVVPWLFVLHCGATNGDVANYMMKTGKWTHRDGRVVYVSAHFNWSNQIGGITQGVPLDHVAWHVGGSRIEYERLKKIWPTAPSKRLDKLNFCSYGLELTGPAGRRFNVGEHNRVKDLIIRLRKQNPQLRVATRHMDICPTKKDPGRQFNMDVFEECGMVVYG